MRPLALLRNSSLAALSISLCSCASVSVQDVQGESSRGVPRPKHITVEPFSLRGTQLKENAMRKNHGQLGPEAQQLVAKYLVQEIEKMGIPASVDGRQRTGPGEWVVSGRFTRIAEGSRILRMGIGLGVGGTKMETLVDVRSAAAPQKPFLHFATTGGSNATPGAATNPIPFSAAPTALLDSKEGVTDDSARTARMIAATLGEYMVHRGWIDASRVPHKRKEKGKL